MDFIQQAFNERKGFWRYLVGSLIVIIAAFIGQIPFGQYIFNANIFCSCFIGAFFNFKATT